MFEGEYSDIQVGPMTVVRQQCTACGETISELARDTTCPVCGSLLEVVHPTPRRSGSALRAQWDKELATHANGTTSAVSGVWRYADVVLPVPLATVVSHPEGNTPLLRRERISAWAGVGELWIKHEGHNPTGSFKDRGMTVAVTQARRVGADGVVCASTGNTSSSLASYAAHAGIPAVVLAPAGQIALGKLAQTLAYGARTVLVRGDFDECLRLVRESSAELNLYLVNSLNPFRIEGQKTIVFELLQQLRWETPDWIVLPAGNLGNTSAFGKALRELYAWGVIDRLPRLAPIQAAGAAPFATSYDEHFATRHRVTAHTVATAIKIGDPASYDRAVRAVRETQGVVLAVTDDEILEAKAVIDAAGVGCEPASAASVAGVRKLRQLGHVRIDDRVVAVLTGHMLKDPAVMIDYHQKQGTRPFANRPMEIEATVGALAEVLSVAQAE